MTDMFEGPHGLTIVCDNPRQRAYDHAEYTRLQFKAESEVRQNKDGSFTVVLAGKLGLSDITFTKQHPAASPATEPQSMAQRVAGRRK